MLRTFLAALLAVTGVLAAAPASRAAPAGAEAETLFREAKRLMAEGKIAEACAAFEKSQRLDPTVSTLLNEASCREKNNQLATAWGLFLEAERQTRGAADEPGKKLHKVAVDHAARLEPRVSKLTIRVSAENRTEGLEISRGGDRADEVEWNRALPVDGGAHTITARAPGKADWSTTVTVGMEGDAQTVDVPKLASLPPAPVVAVTAPAPPPPPSTPPPSAPPSAPASAPPVADLATRPPAPSPAPRGFRVAPALFAAGAVVALGGAYAFNLWGDDTYNQSKREPDPTTQDNLYNSANLKRYIAEGLVGVGAGCAVAALWLYLRGAGDDRAAPAASAGRVVLAPLFGGGHAGLGLVTSY
jgi:hypothetical protein